jgi:pimeloyl-ACP methyl ester carboxylesterase
MVPGWPGNPDDVANLGAGLSGSGVNMVMFNPRGMHASEGSFSFSNVLADIDAALAWLGLDDIRTRFNIDPAKIALGGHSMGGGLVMVYAGTHPSAPRRIIGVAPADVGQAVDDLLNNPATQASMRSLLTTPGAFPVRITDIQGTIAQIKADGNRYWLKDAAPKLTERSILLIGGWDDPTVTMEAILPFYRALKRGGAPDVTFLSYHDGHQFAIAKQHVATDIANWLRR